MITSYTITIPIPPRAIGPNGRCHRMKKHRLCQAYKQTVGYIALGVLAGNKPKWVKATYTVEWFAKRKTLLDEDNADGSLKYARDALQAVEMIADDKGLSRTGFVFAVDRTNPRVVLTITEASE